jgi:1,2-phenylacetyl-CoA epoxidase catalytic subunit
MSDFQKGYNGPGGGADVHEWDAGTFIEHTRSFEFWFGAVGGYLEGSTYGHSVDTPEAVLEPAERDRLVTVLCNYCVGETIALEGAGALISIAPDRAAKIFLSTQTVDEGRHLEVLVHRLLELGVTDPEGEIDRRTMPNLHRFRERHADLVRRGDWDAALFAQNVILEEMEFAVFRRHAELADPRTREVLLGIVKDERRHIGFGENELGRRLQRTPEVRPRLAAVRAELDPLVLDCFRETLAEVDGGESEMADLSDAYLAAVGRLGFA